MQIALTRVLIKVQRVHRKALMYRGHLEILIVDSLQVVAIAVRNPQEVPQVLNDLLGIPARRGHQVAALAARIQEDHQVVAASGHQVVQVAKGAVDNKLYRDKK